MLSPQKLENVFITTPAHFYYDLMCICIPVCLQASNETELYTPPNGSNIYLTQELVDEIVELHAYCLYRTCSQYNYSYRLYMLGMILA